MFHLSFVAGAGIGAASEQLTAAGSPPARLIRCPGSAVRRVRQARVVVRRAEEEPAPTGGQKKEFRLVETNGDLIIATLGLTVGPFVAKYLLQLAGVPDLQAGIWIGFGMAALLVTWTATYFFRVATKDMTYAKQLREYEDGVLQKRFEELSDEELEALNDEISVRDKKSK